MSDPKRIELERYTKWLRREVGSKAAGLLSEHLQKECGTATIWEVPVPIIETLFAKLGSEKDPNATLKALEALARPQSGQPGFPQS